MVVRKTASLVVLWLGVALALAPFAAIAQQGSTTILTLPQAGPITGAEIFPLDQKIVVGGSIKTVQAPLSAIQTFINSHLPPAGFAAVGGVFSSTPAAHQFAKGVTSLGNMVYGQPDYSDLSGVLPAPSSTALGGILSSTAPLHQFGTGVDGTGRPTYAQPAIGDLSNSAQIVLTADNNTQLSSLSTVAISRVRRMGFASPGDGGEGLYTASTSACALNGGAGDGGSQVPSADGRCWFLAVPNTVDVRAFGAVLDWNGTTGTDNKAADTAAIAFACKLSQIGYSLTKVSDGGAPQGISGPLPIAACKGVLLDLHIHAIPGSTWTNGISTTSNLSFYGPNLATPIVMLSGIWTPPSPWPSASITAISNLGGVTQLTLSASLGLSTGNRVLVSGSFLSSLNNTFFATVVDATHITVPLAYAATAAGGLVWGPLPVGMIDAQGDSYGVHIGTSTIDCNLQPQCVPVTNYGNQGAFGVFTDEGATIFGFASGPGVFGFGLGANVKAYGGIVRQSGSTQGSRNGYGFYFAGNSADNYVQGVDLAYTYAGVFCDFSPGDCNVRVSHTYSGSNKGTAGGPYYQICNTIFKSSGSFVSNTIDSGPVCIYTDVNGTSPQVQINANFGEALQNSLFDAPVVYFAGCSTPGCASLSINGSGLGIDPFQNEQYAISGGIGSWQSYPSIALESAPLTGQPNGIINSSAWSKSSLDMEGRLNSHTSTFGRHTSNITSQAAVSFSGTLTSGSSIVTSAMLFPTIGATISDSGGCLTGSPVLGWDNFFNGNRDTVFTSTGVLYLAGGATAATSCANDTITVNGASWTGATVTAGSSVITNVNFKQASLRPGVALTGTGIPSGSYVTGWDIAGQRLEFGNPAGTGATANGTQTLTMTPSSYTLQPQDDGTAFLLGAAATLSLSPFVIAGWNVELDVTTATAITMTPLGSATLNGGTAAATLATGQNLVSAVGTFSAASSYLTSIPYLPLAGGTLKGTLGFATSSTGTATQTFTNSPCTTLTTEKWIPVTITGQTGTFYVPSCQ